MAVVRRIAAIRNADNDGHGWVINVNTKISNGSDQRNRERRSRTTMIEALVGLSSTDDHGVAAPQAHGWLMPRRASASLTNAFALAGNGTSI